MKTKLLTSVAAAALIATSGLAFAQGRDPAPAGPQTSPAPQAAPAPQRNAPPEKIAPPAGTTGQSMDSKGAAGGKADMNVDKKAKSAADNDRNAVNADDKAGPKVRSSSDTKRNGSDNQRTGAQQDKSGVSTTTTSQSGGSVSGQTTGQGAAASRTQVNLSSEQKTKITTVIKQQDMRPVTNVNFNISVGTRVPREQIVTYWKPLPATVVEVYPQWRGYYFILVGGEIVIIEPSTYEIVYVMSA
jgi:hypothetical protein